MSLKEKFQSLLWRVPEDEYEKDEKNEYEEETSDEVVRFDYDDDYDDEDDFEEPEPEPTPQRRSFFGGVRQSQARQEPEEERDNVINISGKTKVKVALFNPMTFGDETRIIADELIQKHTVIVNLEKTEREVSRRIIDFLSGVAYAYGGSIKRIATGTFIIIPYNVDLTGDLVADEGEGGIYF